MKQIIDPKDFGLHPKTRIEQTGKSRYILVIERKSRIIMSDGKKILEKAEKIRALIPGVRVDLRTTAPVCSKTVTFLKEHGIVILDEASL